MIILQRGGTRLPTTFCHTAIDSAFYIPTAPAGAGAALDTLKRGGSSVACLISSPLKSFSAHHVLKSLVAAVRGTVDLKSFAAHHVLKSFAAVVRGTFLM